MIFREVFGFLKQNYPEQTRSGIGSRICPLVWQYCSIMVALSRAARVDDVVRFFPAVGSFRRFLFGHRILSNRQPTAAYLPSTTAGTPFEKQNPQTVCPSHPGDQPPLDGLLRYQAYGPAGAASGGLLHTIAMIRSFCASRVRRCRRGAAFRTAPIRDRPAGNDGQSSGWPGK